MKMMVSVLAMPQAGQLNSSQRQWLALRAEHYRTTLVSEGVNPETARQRAYTRAVNNIERAAAQ